MQHAGAVLPFPKHLRSILCVTGALHMMAGCAQGPIPQVPHAFSP